jgi:hypothetical protein
MKICLNANLSTVDGLAAGALQIIDHNRGVPDLVSGQTKKCSDSRFAKSSSRFDSDNLTLRVTGSRIY